MQICLLDRESFLGWLNGEPSPKPTKLTATKMRQPLKNDIAIIYDNPTAADLSHQPIIAVPQNKITDFYAFVGTYVAGYKPFSAFFRVVPFELLAELTNARSIDDQLGLPVQRLIGVAMAEVYTQSRARTKVFDKISVSAVQATLSASLFEAVCQGYERDRIDEVSRRWQATRDFEHSDTLFLEPNKIVEVWSIVSDILSGKTSARVHGSHKKVAQALKQAMFSSRSSHEWLSPLMRDFPSIARDASGLGRSREERVRLVRSILPELLTSRSDILSREFLAGTVISMIGNGSFAQIALLDEILPELPAAALWFGVLSAFQNSGDALTVGNCLGRRVVRDMCTNRDLFTPVKADIAFEELAVFGNETRSAHSFRTAQASSMTVSLLAGVTGRFKIGTSTDSDPARQKQDARLRENREQAEELMFLLDRARQVVGKLAGGRQRDLFDEK